MAKQNFEIDILVEAKKAIAALENVKAKLEGTAQQTTKAGGAATGMGSGFAQAAIGIGAAVAALTSVVSVSKEFIQLAQKQEIAEVKLATGMRRLGDETGEATKRLQDQASAMQELTGIGDEATISAQAMLTTFNMSEEGIATLTPRLLDMAAAYQQTTGGTMDLQQAAVMLGKATTAGVGALKRYGVTLTAAQEAQYDAAQGMDKINLLAEILDGNFKGTAEAIGNTSVGAYQKLDAAVGDFKENLGFLIIDFLKPLINVFMKVVYELREFTNRGTESQSMLGTLIDANKVLVELFIAIFEIIGEVAYELGIMGKGAKGAAGAIEFLRKAVHLLRTGILGMKAIVRGVIDMIKEAGAVIKEFWASVTSLRFDKLAEIMMGAPDRMNKAFKKGFNGVVKEANEAAKKVEPAMLKMAGTGSESAAKGGKSKFDMLIAELNREQSLELAQMDFMQALESDKLEVKKEYLEKQLALAIQYKKETADVENAIALTEIEIMKKREEESKAEAERLKKENDAKMAAREKIEEFLTALQIQRSDEDGQVLIQEQQRLQTELSAFNEMLEQKLIDEDEYNLFRELARSSHLDRIAGMEAENAEKLRKIAEDTAKKEAEIRAQNEKAIISGSQQLFGDLASASAKNFEAQKAFSVIQATIKTYESATSAYAAMAGIPVVGPVLGAFASAAAVAAGLANVSAISSQQAPSYRGGGYTGSGDPDRTAGTVEYREMVMNEAATAQNRYILERMNAGMDAETAVGSPSGLTASKTSVGVHGTFRIAGNDLLLVLEENAQKNMTGTY